MPDERVNITTGLVASPEVSLGLGNFLEVAQKRNITFVEKRLVVDRTLSFWDTDKRSKTPTFVNMSKSLTSNKPDKTMIKGKGKGKGMILYSAVSSPLDRSKRFTLSSPGRPVHSDTVLGFSWKHSSHAAIAQRLFTHISTTVYSQVLIYTAESTEAS